MVQYPRCRFIRHPARALIHLWLVIGSETWMPVCTGMTIAWLQ